MGNTAAISPFSSSPVPMLAAISHAQRPWMRLVVFQRAQEPPHGQRDA